MSNINIDTSALLVEFSASVWTGRRLDKTVTDEVITSKNAAARGAARVNKDLMAGRPELKDIESMVTQVRTYLYTNTLPWSDSGQRLLPAAQFLKFNERMATFEEEFREKVDSFVAVYPTLITAQAMALGDMFKRDDYPTADSIARRFAFHVDYLPVPSSGDFRIDIGNEAQRELRERMEKLGNQRVEAAVQDLRDRVLQHLERMSDRLVTETDDKGQPKARRFHDTLVTGTFELCDLMNTLNITGDPRVSQARLRLETALSGISAEDLRKEHDTRDAVKKEVDAVLNQWRLV